jgi:hypothetical protein
MLQLSCWQLKKRQRHRRPFRKLVSRREPSIEYRRVRRGVERVNKIFHFQLKHSNVLLEAKRGAKKGYEQARADLNQKAFRLEKAQADLKNAEQLLEDISFMVISCELRYVIPNK